MEKNKPDNKVNKWLVFTSMPVQIGVTIWVFYKIGTWLDAKYLVEGEWWMKGFTMLGVIISLAQFIRQVKYISKDE